MKLLFKQRFFTWFDSYDIFDENGDTVYTVEGKFAWGKCLHILDRTGAHIATLKQRVFTFLPTFDLYTGGEEEYVVRFRTLELLEQLRLWLKSVCT